MSCKVAIIGACSLAGREILKTLSDRSFPLTEIRLFEAKCSVGQMLSYKNNDVLVEEISEHVLKESRFRFVFFAAGYQVSQHLMSLVRETGAIVIDLSAYAYQNLSSPLSVPFIFFNNNEHNIYSNPVSLVTHLACVLFPIHSAVPIKRIIVSTYQSVSGAGFFGVEELERQTDEIENGKEASIHYFEKQIAFNVIPQVEHFVDDSSWTKEEITIQEELNNILGQDINISVTSVRVPVLRGHSASVTIELASEISLDEFADLLTNAEINVYRNDYPTPWDLEGTVDIGVGRIRKDKNIEKCFHFWTVADNLSLGMGINPVSIAESLL